MFTIYFCSFQDDRDLAQNKTIVRDIALAHYREKLDQNMRDGTVSNNNDISVVNVSQYTGAETGRRIVSAGNVHHVMTSGNGKPYLADGKFCFSISHSGKYYLLAAGPVNLGLDLQLYNLVRDYMKIAERWYRPEEIDLLHSLRGAQQEDTFYEIWTRKEAYGKFTGKGMLSATEILTVRDGGLREKYPTGQFISLEDSLKPLFKDVKFKLKMFI